MPRARTSLPKASALLVALLFVFAPGIGCGGGSDSSADPNFVVDCSLYPPQASSPYVLPYPVGTSYLAATTTAHPADHRYAIDFMMPIGTTISAGRAGKVYDAQESFYDDDHLPDHANYVFVLHDDSTLGLYGHLTHNGALVSKDDLVTQGQPVGLSGNSGQSTGPHLHFEVVRCTVTAWANGQECPTVNTVSMPVVFRNTIPTPCGLQAGTSYLAQPN